MHRTAMARDNKLTAVGEHHVCAQLARREWAPSLTRDRLARTDILAMWESSIVTVRPR